MTESTRICASKDRDGNRCGQPALTISNYCRHHWRYHNEPVSTLPEAAIPRYQSGEAIQAALQRLLDQLHRKEIQGKAFYYQAQMLERAIGIMRREQDEKMKLERQQRRMERLAARANPVP